MTNNGWNVPKTDRNKINKIVGFVVSEIPEELRSVVLESLLQIYLSRGVGLATAEKKSKHEKREGEEFVTEKKQDDKDLNFILQQPVDWAKYDKVFIEKGNLLDKSLLIISEAQNYGCEWLMPSEITKVLKDKARVPGVYSTNVSNVLKNARRMVDRRERGTGYEYRLMKEGEEHVKGLVSGGDGE